MVNDIKNVLVIGLGGQLGTCIYDYVNDNPNSGVVFKFTRHFQLDISTEWHVINELRNNKYDYVINCSAFTNVDACTTNVISRIHAIKTNFLGVDNLVRWCTHYGVKLIHISTDYVFDGNTNTGYNETSKTNPINDYGITKLYGEDAIVLQMKDYMIIRVSTLYSKYGNNIVKKLYSLLKDGKPINAICDNSFNPTYAPDLAEFIIDKIIYNNNFNTGILHYGSTPAVSTYELTNIIQHEINDCNSVVTPTLFSDYVTPVRRPQYSFFDFDKINRLYGDSLPNTETSIKKLVNILKN